MHNIPGRESKVADVFQGTRWNAAADFGVSSPELTRTGCKSLVVVKWKTNDGRGAREQTHPPVKAYHVNRHEEVPDKPDCFLKICHNGGAITTHRLEIFRV